MKDKMINMIKNKIKYFKILFMIIVKSIEDANALNAGKPSDYVISPNADIPCDDVNKLDADDSYDINMLSVDTIEPLNVNDIKKNIVNQYSNLINQFLVQGSDSTDGLEDILVKDSILIRFMENVTMSDINSLEDRYDLMVDTEIIENNFKLYSYYLQSTSTISLGLIKEINELPFVMYAEPNYKCAQLTSINDPLIPNFKPDYEPNNSNTDSITLEGIADYYALWGLKNQTNPGIDINLEGAWKTTKGNPSVIVAVIDSGIDYNHTQLKDNIWINVKEISNNRIDDDRNGYIDDTMGWNFYNNNNNVMDGFAHGTHASGTIGAIENQSMSGIAPKIKLMPLKIFANDGSMTDSSTIISAIKYAHDNGASIVNMSFGGKGKSQSFIDLMNKYTDMLFVSAAGNNSLNNDITPFYPACYETANNISVASIDQDGSLSYYSNYGLKTVNVAAPGRQIYSTLPNNKLGYMSGTSMAAPHVSGVAALVKSNNMNLTPVQIKQIIMNTVKPLPSLKGKTVTGGLVDAGKAVVANINIPKDTPIDVPKAPPVETIKDIFPDNILANEIASQLRKSVNDPLSLTESNKIVSIDIKNGVNNAKGIERLTNLSTLKLTHGGLTSVDLSKNVNLVTLELQYNKIASINLSSNVKLQSLILYSNMISSIDLTKNVALTSMNLSYNQLTTLDLSNNINSDQIYAENNKLNKMNFGNATKNRIIFLSYNNLTSLDLTNQKSLIYYRLNDNPFITNGLKLPSQKLINYA
ncbi:MAG: S8 family serine peptidase [Oscillospiraceae bacterium]|nr:S8 family serine peptidase [Oscillospiraceae bacterium]